MSLFYADQLCISTRYLSAITKQVAENSAKEIIDENLILELKMALQSTGMSLKEIADKYRFPDQSFFGRYFKKHTGNVTQGVQSKEELRYEHAFIPFSSASLVFF